MEVSRELNRQVLDRLEDMFRDVKLAHMQTHIREHHQGPRRTPEHETHAGSCPQSRKNSVDTHRSGSGHEVRRPSHEVRRTSTGARRTSNTSTGSGGHHGLPARKGSGGVRRFSMDSLESGRRDSLASVGSGGSGGSGHLADLIEENEEEQESLHSGLIANKQVS